MMMITLYDAKGSGNSLKILSVAYELDLPIHLIPIDMLNQEHKSPAYMAKNPNGKVPLLEEGSFHLWESNAIMLYLASKNPRQTLVPVEAKQRAEVDKWMFWQTAHLSPAIGKIAFELFYKERMNLGPMDPVALAAGKEELKRFAAVLDQHLSTHKYVANDQLSVADFALAAAFAIKKHIPLDIEGYKHIQTWLQMIESRPSYGHAQKVSAPQ